jgi:disulfide bond formation protein DsbB
MLRPANHADRLGQRPAINRFRPLALIAMLGSVALLGGALAFQYIGGLAPCPLCIDQRWAHAAAIAAGLLILIRPRRYLALVGAAAVLVGAGIGVYHAGIEQNWWPGPTTCTAPSPTGVDAGALLDQILETPVVLCDEIAWSMAGISMAGWNAILSLVLAALWLRAYASSSASQ